MSDSNLKIQIDAEEIASQFGDLKYEVEEALTEAVRQASVMAYGIANELAAEKLNSRLKTYQDALSYEEVSPGLWTVSLDESAFWIEEGRKCVVYQKTGIKKQPKILTPDGEIPITEVKIGTLVLNKYGKWTPVVKIWDDHLVEESRMDIYKVEACRVSLDDPKLNKRRYIVGFSRHCPKCGFIDLVPKLNARQIKRGQFCKKCYSNKQLTTLSIPTKEYGNLTLTSDHKVMTENGWIQAGDLSIKNNLQIPSWNSCLACNKPAPLYKKYCSLSCNATIKNMKLVNNGKHWMLNPKKKANAFKNALKKMANKKNINNPENVVDKMLQDMGYKVGFYGDGEHIDVIRQYPIPGKIDRRGGQHYYYADFFFKKLNLVLEIDGDLFHAQNKHQIRDSHRTAIINRNIGAEVVRIRAKNVFLENFKEQTLVPILSNHEGEISFLKTKIKKLRHFRPDYNCTSYRKWDIQVAEGASFVCNGILIHNSGDMREDLLKNNAKVSKDGTRYKVIPFEHSKNPSQQTSRAREISQMVKKELKARNIPYKKIERDEKGSPRLGKLHSFSVPGSPKPSPKAKFGALSGINIYQRMEKGRAVRDIMTFRTITSKKDDRWMHPGLQAEKILDQTFDKIQQIFDLEILPEVLRKYSAFER